MIAIFMNGLAKAWFKFDSVFSNTSDGKIEKIFPSLGASPSAHSVFLLLVVFVGQDAVPPFRSMGLGWSLTLFTWTLYFASTHLLKHSVGRFQLADNHRLRATHPLFLLQGLILVLSALARIILGILFPEKSTLESGLWHVNLATFLVFPLLIIVASFGYYEHARLRRHRGFEILPALREVNLHEPIGRDYRLSDFGRGLLNAILNFPHHLILSTAMAIAFLPVELWQSKEIIAGLMFTATLLVYLFPAIDTRLTTFIPLIDRLFFRGGQLGASLLVIGIAVLRFQEIQYIQILMESSPCTVFSCILALYACFWFADAWLNRFMTQTLFRSFSKGNATAPLDYQFGPENQARSLRIHGVSRFSSVVKDSPELTRFFDRTELLAFIRTGHDEFRKFSAVYRLHSRIYFRFATTIIICMLLLILTISLRAPKSSIARYDFRESVSKPQFDLQKHLFASKPQEKPILLAAAGGGTRAALFTASVLYGLRKADLLRNVRLVSGVSGGGYALAYYVQHYEALEKNPAEWSRFFRAMQNEYIEFVLSDGLQLRMLFKHRAGKLLEEGFAACMAASSDIPFRQRCSPKEREFRATATKIGDIKNVGLILNAAIAGHYKSECKDEPTDCESLEAFADSAYRNAGKTVRWQAGAPFVFTNLSDRKPFKLPKVKDPSGSTDDDSDVKKEDGYNLHIEAMPGGDTTLAQAASAIANFPPVFSNASVDYIIENKYTIAKRFWLTDGGASENRGVIPLLAALLNAVKHQKGEQKDALKSHPGVIVLVADGGATDPVYSQDRGIGTLLDAKEKYASQLMNALIREINGHAESKEFVKVHYISIPEALRARGGLGTHWSLPHCVPIRDPYGYDDKKYLVQSHVIVRKLLTLFASNTCGHTAQEEDLPENSVEDRGKCRLEYSQEEVGKSLIEAPTLQWNEFLIDANACKKNQD